MHKFKRKQIGDSGVSKPIPALNKPLADLVLGQEKKTNEAMLIEKLDVDQEIEE